uniref:Myotubularin phosphatase domain-containing protein n=1 Tax=Romanomermis culicivorax TaxID=13658 RepID=A0A915KHZ2_ROMCU
MSNIHAVRYSFQQLRTLCWESCTTANGAGSSQNSESSSSAWLQALDSTQWIAYLHILLASALKVVETLHYQAKCVLVHCSDGWDRTTQIISLAKLMLDPYYRTMAGFKELIEREWIAFGHKFGERTGLLAGDTSQRAPIFLQWLDCVRHIHKANPCSFEFNEIYLVKLAQHVYSGLFGNFLCNSAHEHITNNVSSRTFSIWSFLHPMNDQFKNILFVDPTKDTDMKTRNVLTTPYKVRDLTDLWQLLHCPQNADPAIKRQTNLMTLSTTSLESSATLSDDSDHTVMALSIASLLNNNNFSNLSTSSIMNEDQTDNNDFSISYKEITSDSDFYGVENSSFCPFLGKDEKETAIGEESSVVNAMISRLIGEL